MTDPEIHSEPDEATPQGGTVRLPRSRGAVSGVLLVLAGVWGAFVPFVGPYFHFAYTPKPDQTWHWTAARGWFEVLPGGLAFLGGLLLILSANRIVTSLGAWIAALAGGWFVVGQQVSFLLTLGSPGAPAAAGDRRYVAEYLAFFTGLGAVIILFAGLALGRLSVRSVRDVQAAARRDQAAALAEQEAADREDGERDEDERSTADRAVTDRNAETWAAGERGSGYGTPGASETDREPVEHPASAVTSELPAAGVGAAAGAGALYANERPTDDAVDHDDAAADPTGSDQHAPYRRRGGSTAVRPDDDTVAMPVVPETDSPEPHVPEPHVPEPHVPEPHASETDAAEAVPAEPPLELTPPDGHPDATSDPAAPAAEPSETTKSTSSTEPGAASWNPEAQSPTTTGEMPALGSDPVPPATTEAPRRGIQQPRRYYGPDDPARATTSSADAPPRDAVRTDEAGDLDDLDLDERDH